MSDKTIGYTLLGTGLLTMVITVLYVLLVFTGKTEPVALFNIPAPTLNTNLFMPDTSAFGSTLSLPSNEIEIIPTEQFNKILNLSVTFFFMGFVVTVGFKIASLGIMFLRPIKVTLKESQQPTSTQNTTSP